MARWSASGRSLKPGARALEPLLAHAALRCLIVTDRHGSIVRFFAAGIELRKRQRSRADAVVHLRSVLEMHAAEASTKRGSIRQSQDRPIPTRRDILERVAIIAGDLKGVGVLGYKSIAAGTHENGQDVRRLDGEPLSAHMSRAKMLVQVSLKLEGDGRLDPPEQSQFERVPVWRSRSPLRYSSHPDLDRGTSISSSPRK